MCYNAQYNAQESREKEAASMKRTRIWFLILSLLCALLCGCESLTLSLIHI